MKKPLSTEAYEGDDVTIFCEVIGDPKPEVVWLRDFLKVREFIYYMEFRKPRHVFEVHRNQLESFFPF